MGWVLNKLKKWNQQGLDLQKDVIVKVAELLSDIDEMPDGPQKDAAYKELNDYASNPFGYTITHGLEAAEDVIEDVLEDIIPDLGDAGLKFVRGLGGALFDAAEGLYDTAAHRISGKSTEIITSLTIASVTILTVVYLFNAAKSGKV